MILFNNVASQWKEIEHSALPEITKFLGTGPYIGGKEVEKFESDFKDYCSAKYAIGVSNGTDALRLALQTVLEKNCVRNIIYISANAHISNALAPAHLGYLSKLRLIDCDENYNMDIDFLKERILIDSYIQNIIIITHLYGQPVDIDKIKKIAPKSIIIEDCSQAQGATIKGKHVGTIGDIGIFSLYPTKNLGAMGDAGIIITNNKYYNNRLIMLRNYGSSDKVDYVDKGWNARLDPLQALILRHKLPLLNKWNEKRRAIANQYHEGLKNIKNIILPLHTDNHVYHIFPIRIISRNKLKEYLYNNGIETMIHYPIPIEKTSAFSFLYENKNPNTIRYAQELLSLPIHPYLTSDEINKIIVIIKKFFLKGNDGYTCYS